MESNLQNSQSLSLLEDTNIQKIMSQRQKDFKLSMSDLTFPICQKSQSHSNYPLKYVAINRIQEDSNDQLCLLEAQCELCIKESAQHTRFMDLKEMLIHTFNIADSQCNTNSYQECINPSLKALEESLQQLYEIKSKLSIYCDEVKTRVDNLRAKAISFPPIKVRDTIQTLIDGCKEKNSEDEKNQTLLNELDTLASRLTFNEKSLYNLCIKGETLDVSLYYVLSQKIRSDIHIISQNIDRGCFLLNDIDQSDFNSTNSRNFTQFLNESPSQILQDPIFLEYKKRMQNLGLQDTPLMEDKHIDYSCLFKYEQFKFHGIQKYNSYKNSQQKVPINRTDNPQTNITQQRQQQQQQQLFVPAVQVSHMRSNRNAQQNSSESINIDPAGGRRQKIFGKENNLSHIPKQILNSSDHPQ